MADDASKSAFSSHQSLADRTPERHLRAELAVAAWRMAIAARGGEPGLLHHSDRGVQYASHEYTGLLQEYSISISMSRRGNVFDNAKAERFMRTLKYEEVYMFEYEDMAEARQRIGYFLEEVYNRKRLHSALGYVPSAEFEQSLFSQYTLTGCANFGVHYTP